MYLIKHFSSLLKRVEEENYYHYYYYYIYRLVEDTRLVFLVLVIALRVAEVRLHVQ